ncbi:MAG: ExbD/TolR family protein [Armatimonadaceae bacterium]
MAFRRRREIKKTKIEIIPMIDTMFFLLVFFILASLNVIDMKGSRVDLPDSVNQDSQARAKVTITITKEQKVSVNQGKAIGKGGSLGSELLSALTSDSASGAITVRPEDAIVVINADSKAPYSIVRKVVDEARQVRFRKFSIATDPKLGF